MVVLAQKRHGPPQKSCHTGSPKTGFVYILGLTLVYTSYAVRRTMVLAAKWAPQGPSARASKWEFACRCFDDTILKE